MNISMNNVRVFHQCGFSLYWLQFDLEWPSKPPPFYTFYSWMQNWFQILGLAVLLVSLLYQYHLNIPVSCSSSSTEYFWNHSMDGDNWIPDIVGGFHTQGLSTRSSSLSHTFTRGHSAPSLAHRGDVGCCDLCCRPGLGSLRPTPCQSL